MYDKINFEIPEEVLQDIKSVTEGYEESEKTMWLEYFGKRLDVKKFRELAGSISRAEFPFGEVTTNYIKYNYNQIRAEDYKHLDDLFEKKLVMLRDVKSLKRDCLGIELKDKYPELSEKILKEEVNEPEVKFLLEQKQIDVELVDTEIEKWKHTLDTFYNQDLFSVKLGNEESE